MPRHLFNATHFDVRRTGGPDEGPSDAQDGMTGACGARDVVATRRPEHVTCRRCLDRLSGAVPRRRRHIKR